MRAEMGYICIVLQISPSVSKVLCVFHSSEIKLHNIYARNPSKYSIAKYLLEHPLLEFADSIHTGYIISEGSLLSIKAG
jgi:hypothetical protein